MKKLLFFLLVICIRQVNAQTWVNIPDANFAIYLRNHIPAAMSGDSLNTSSTLVTTTTHTINVGGQNIANLFGVQYFTSLTDLGCTFNTFTSLPALPNSLKNLICSYNNLTSLPSLPNALRYMDCHSNALTSLPTLPSLLTKLVCSHNNLTGLPSLPNSLLYIDCSQNTLTNLPTLPNSLTFLYCNNNNLTVLPSLPNAMDTLSCSNNTLTSLPSLPNPLIWLECGNNALTSLPSLPSSLTFLDCGKNALTTLPVLPNSLKRLRCGYNNLTSLPSLPSLYDLFCGNNNITCFPTFPNSMTQPINNYPYGYIYSISIDPNPYTCLPNHIVAMDPTDLAVPLCAAGNINGCAVAGISQISGVNTQISVYPNPASDQFFIATNVPDKLNVDLYDVNGRHVFNANVSAKENINVSTLDNGTYTLTIKMADRVMNKKLVILR